MHKPTFLRRIWWKYLSLRFPWRRKFLRGTDLDGNLYFALRNLQSSGRERRMVKYRLRKDWASYTLTPQWHAWLRHSRDDPPSIEELILDEERKERARELAKAADERWITKGQQSIERLAVGNSEEALKAIQSAHGTKSEDLKEAVPTPKREMPGQDPGATFQPEEWSGKVSRRQ